MSRRPLSIMSHQLTLCLAGTFIGFVAMTAVGCRDDCADWKCPDPIDLASGDFSVNDEKRSFEEIQPPANLPNLSSSSLKIDAERKKVTLNYTDSLGEPVQVTFEQRADGGGAGEGGS